MVLNISLLPVKKEIILYEKHKTLWSIFMDGFNCLNATEPLQEATLLFTTHSPGVPGTHLMEFGRMKG